MKNDKQPLSKLLNDLVNDSQRKNLIAAIEEHPEIQPKKNS